MDPASLLPHSTRFSVRVRADQSVPAARMTTKEHTHA